MAFSGDFTPVLAKQSSYRSEPQFAGKKPTGREYVCDATENQFLIQDLLYRFHQVCDSFLTVDSRWRISICRLTPQLRSLPHGKLTCATYGIPSIKREPIETRSYWLWQAKALISLMI